MNELYSLVPLIIVGAASLVLMLSASFCRSRSVSLGIWALACVSALVALFGVNGSPAQEVGEMLLIDNMGRVIMQMVLLASLVVGVFAFDYLKGKGEHAEEFFIALSVSTLGAMVMAVSQHFIGFFLGLELLTVPVYCMAAYFDQHRKGLEAAMKYIVLAGASAAFLLFGMALIYAQLGTMRFDEMAERLGPMWSSGHVILLTGFALMIVGIAFKLSLAPFHLWTPDVYEGAPLPVTAYLATVSKGAMMALFLRFFAKVGAGEIEALSSMLSFIAIVSMFGGNWLALMQRNLKRLLAYSSIAHMGYMLVAFLSGGPLATGAVMFYLSTYLVTSLLLFGVLIALDKGHSETETLEDLRGLFAARPVLASMLVLGLLSLVGVPLSAGFMGKYFIVVAGINAQQWVLLFSLVASSALGLYAYVKVVLILFQARSLDSVVALSSYRWTRVMLVLLTLGSLLLGFYPSPVIELIRAAI